MVAGVFTVKREWGGGGRLKANEETSNEKNDFFFKKTSI